MDSHPAVAVRYAWDTRVRFPQTRAGAQRMSTRILSALRFSDKSIMILCHGHSKIHPTGGKSILGHKSCVHECGFAIVRRTAPMRVRAVPAHQNTVEYPSECVGLAYFMGDAGDKCEAIAINSLMRLSRPNINLSRFAQTPS